MPASDPMRFEQCVDFACAREFRRSLLCHAGAPVKRPLDPSRLMRCNLTAGLFPPTMPVDLRHGVSISFQSSDGGTFTTNDAGLKSALVAMAVAYPLPVPFEQVWEQTRATLKLPRHDAARDKLAHTVMQLFESHSLEIQMKAPGFITEVRPRPVASPLARWQAAAGRVIHNRRHRTARGLTDLDRSLLQLLDGTRDLPSLRAAITPPESDPSSADQTLRDCLYRIAGNAVLIG
jgi:methyltransferase-like protein